MTTEADGKTTSTTSSSVTTSPAATPKTPTPPPLSELVVEGKKVEPKPAAAATTTDDDGKPKGEATTTDDADGKKTESSATSDEGDDSTSGDDDGTAGAPKKSSGGFQKRIDKLTRIVKEQERQLNTALKALETATGKSATKALDAIDRQDPKPERSAYEDPEKFAEDLASWSGRQGARAALAEREAKEREDQTKNAMEQAQKTYAGLVEAGKKKYPDWEEVAENEDVEISNVMGYAITRSPIGHDIQYYLGKHPKEAARIANLKDGADQLTEIGKLAAKLEGDATRSTVSKTPGPIKPVGGGNAASQKSRNEMSMEEYAAARQPELDAQRRGRTRGSRTH